VSPDTSRYSARRDLDRSPEPRGAGSRDSASADGPVFVVQEHEASTHHYDLRLESSGVLKSWAVPKGPSTDPSEKRLAVATEDHPLEYADFEGTIPTDEYGEGRVIVWDTGSYDNLSRDDDGAEVAIDVAYERGHIAVWLHGRKLTGGYALTRFRGDDQWLLVKMDDEESDARRRPTSTEPESVQTGRTVDDLPTPRDAE
jgi:DNA ligase D-like protein (predicted 3'-phosphoesterase)